MAQSAPDATTAFPLAELPLSAEERHKIMWQNAADLFKIPTPARMVNGSEGGR